MTVDQLNRMDLRPFVANLGTIYEHSPWIAEAAWRERPFASVESLAAAMSRVVAESAADRQLALIREHPELAGRAMARAELTADSANEQSSAGLTQCTPTELAQLAALNTRYRERFGFPFVLAVKGYDRVAIIAELARRLNNDRAAEFAESLRQIDKIARLRLAALVTD
jgi:2-oxo-4-hydroxy-4-carboxy-5-ureidoimidazoline decarboxylase